MNPSVQAAFAAQHGLVRRGQLLDLGLDPGAINRGVRDGAWVRVRRGVYVDPEVWGAADPYRGRPLLRARAAVLEMRRGWVLSHESAAYAHGLDIWAPAESFVHVTRSGFTNAWTKAGVKHHLARYVAEQVVEVDDLRVLDPARTAVDVAREHPEPVGLSACDAALRAGVTRSQLRSAREPMHCWPYSRRMDWCIDHADAGAANAFESAARALLVSLGLGRPETQFPVRLERGVAYCDARIGRHVFELHGRLKYQAPDVGGRARAAAADVLLGERKRERELVAEGLGISNVYVEDIREDRAAETRRRLRAEVAATVDRFGSELPERLVRNAAELRASRHAA